MLKLLCPLSTQVHILFVFYSVGPHHCFLPYPTLESSRQAQWDCVQSGTHDRACCICASQQPSGLKPFEAPASPIAILMWPRRVAARAVNEVALAAGLMPLAATRANLHPFDPEHLIVNGLGGAFLHPTHVFAPARFASVRPSEVIKCHSNVLCPKTT